MKKGINQKKKKTLNILMFFLLVLFKIDTVHAATGSMYVGTDTRQLNVPIVATFYTNSGSGFYEGITSNFDEYNGYFATSDTVTLDGYGEMICFDNPSAFNTNNIYSITLYLGKTGGTYGFKTNVKNERVSIGSSLGSAVGNWNSGAYYADLHYSNYRGTMFEVYDSNYHVIGKASYLTFIFTATGTGTAFCAPFNSAGETNTGYTLFFGYHYDILGSADGLTSSDIQNIISDSGLATASSISQVQQSVNNVKSEIQVMQETQAETNEKLDEQIQQDKEQHDELMNSDISEEDKELPDDSKYQDYTSTEDSLKDKVNQADLSVVSIGIDANSSNWVWNTLTSLIQSNAVIFGMFIAILSIGIIKLALGR